MSPDPRTTGSSGTPSPSQSSPGAFAPTRRAVLRGGAGAAAATSLVGGSLATAGPAVAALPLVQPRPAHAVYSAIGINALPNHLDDGYAYTAQWMASLASTGVSYFRGLYAPKMDQCAVATTEARRRGLRWGMQVATSASTPVWEIRQTIAHIAANAADRCLYVEGINEPDWNRDTSSKPTNWLQNTVDKQRAIWEAVKADSRLSHVKVIGPSLRDVSARESDYKALADRGLLNYMDFGSIHRYPNGHFPDWLMDDRLTMLKRAWPGKPIWVTETGYTNCLANTTGHKPVPEWVAAAYAPSVLLEAVDRGCRTAYFELLDSPDAGAADDREAHFGMFALVNNSKAPPWRTKPVASELKAFLATLKDPGPAFTPARVPLRTTSQATDLRRTVTAKRNGEVTVHLRRATDCWDPIAQRGISVAKIPVKIESASGTRWVSVDHQVTSITL